VPKITVMIIAPRAGVLKISTGTKRPATALLPTARWKQVRLDVRPPPASAAALKALVQP
jgi:hypothetical protein